MIDKKDKIFVAGHGGMVGSAIVRALEKNQHQNIVTCSREEVDLLSQSAVSGYLQAQKPDLVIIAAAKVGGIFANNAFPADFIYQNLMIQSNLIHGSFEAGVNRLLFLGSSCIYPKFAKQPMTEGELLSGKLESTNEPYAIAKIAGIKMCESYNRQYGTDYRSVMPTNLYGINDNFHPKNSHVIPALLRRFHEAVINEAESVLVWGTGNARREFLNVDDMASACLHVIQLATESYQKVTEPMLSHINVGTGEDISIKELASLVAETVGFTGDVLFDVTKPDGTPKKLLSIDALLSTDWRPSISLKQGLAQTYAWLRSQQGNYRI